MELSMGANNGANNGVNNGANNGGTLSSCWKPDTWGGWREASLFILCWRKHIGYPGRKSLPGFQAYESQRYCEKIV